MAYPCSPPSPFDPLVLIPSWQEGEVAGDEGDIFRRILLQRCQHHFESKRELTAEERADLDQMEIDYLEMRFRMKRIGNMRFVGELFNTNLLAGRIIKVCLEVLLSGESTTGTRALTSFFFFFFFWCCETMCASWSRVVFETVFLILSSVPPPLRPHSGGRDRGRLHAS